MQFTTSQKRVSAWLMIAMLALIGLALLTLPMFVKEVPAMRPQVPVMFVALLAFSQVIRFVGLLLVAVRRVRAGSLRSDLCQN